MNSTLFYNVQLVIGCGRRLPHLFLPLNILVGDIPLSGRPNLDTAPVPLEITGNENPSLPPINLTDEQTLAHQVNETVLPTSFSGDLGNIYILTLNINV